MFGKLTVVFVNKYKILKHNICRVAGKYTSVVAVRNEDGRILHIELINEEIAKDVSEFKGAYIEVTEYSNKTFSMKIFN